MIVYIVAVIVILLATMIEILQFDEDTLTAKLYIELQRLSSFLTIVNLLFGVHVVVLLLIIFIVIHF